MNMHMQQHYDYVKRPKAKHWFQKNNEHTTLGDSAIHGDQANLSDSATHSNQANIISNPIIHSTHANRGEPAIQTESATFGAYTIDSDTNIHANSMTTPSRLHILEIGWPHQRLNYMQFHAPPFLQITKAPMHLST